MAHPYHHALSSVKKWGGRPEEYLPIHEWFDHSKEILANFRHRALRHHAEGIFLCETIFGSILRLSTGRMIPVRWIGEQHVREDLGTIPSFADWARAIRAEPWMNRSQRLSEELENVAIPDLTSTIDNGWNDQSPDCPVCGNKLHNHWRGQPCLQDSEGEMNGGNKAGGKA